MSAGHTMNAGGKNLIKSLVLRSVCRAAPALPAFSSLHLTDKWQNTKDGHLILVDFLLVLTVARVDVLCGAVAWSFTQGLRDQQYSQINETIFGWWIKSGWKTWLLDICQESATQCQGKTHPKPQEAIVTVQPRRVREHGSYSGGTERGNEAQVEHIRTEKRKKRKKKLFSNL